MIDTRAGRLIDAMAVALDGGGSTAPVAYLDDGSRLHVPGASGLGGDYEGRDAICALLDRMSAATGGSLRFHTTGTRMASTGRVWLEGEISGGRGERLLTTTATLETSIADDVVREAWLWCADQAAWDAFWG